MKRLAASALGLSFVLAFWILSREEAVNPVSISMARPAEEASPQGLTLPLAPLSEAPHESSHATREPASESARPGTEEGEILVRWRGEEVDWDLMTLRHEGEEIWEGDTGDTWRCSASRAASVDVQVDGWRGEGLTWTDDHWVADLALGTEFMVVDKETSRTVEGAYLEFPDSFFEGSSVEGRLLAPAVWHSRRASLTAPGYLTEPVALVTGRPRALVVLRRSTRVEVVARVRASDRRHRLQVQTTEESRLTFFERPVRGDLHREVLSLPKGKYVFYLQRQEPSPSPGVTKSSFGLTNNIGTGSWNTLDRSQLEIEGGGSHLVELSDGGPLATLEGELLLPEAWPADYVRLVVHDHVGRYGGRQLFFPLGPEKVLNWSIPDLAPGRYHLAIQPSLLHQHTFEIRAGVPPEALRIDLTDVHTLRVRVKDASTGADLRGARVHASQGLQMFSSRGPGLYSGHCLSGPNDVHVFHKDFASSGTKKVFVNGDNQTLEVALEPAQKVTLRLHIQDQQGSLALDLGTNRLREHLILERPDGQRVLIRKADGPTSPTGPLSLTLAAPGPLRLIVDLPGYERIERRIELNQKYVELPGQQTIDLELQLKASMGFK